MDNCISNIELNGILQETNLDIILNEYHYFNNNIALNEGFEDKVKEIGKKIIEGVKKFFENLITVVKKFFKGIIDFIKNLFKKRKFENGKIVSENTEIIQEEGLIRSVIAQKLKNAMDVLKKEPEEDLGLFPYTNLIKKFHTQQDTLCEKIYHNSNKLLESTIGIKDKDNKRAIDNCIDNINELTEKISDEALHIMVDKYSNIKGDSITEKIVNFYTTETKDDNGWTQWEVTTHDFPAVQILECACDGKNWIKSIEKTHGYMLAELENLKNHMITRVEKFESTEESPIITSLLSYTSKATKTLSDVIKASNKIEKYWSDEAVKLLTAIFRKAKIS